MMSALGSLIPTLPQSSTAVCIPTDRYLLPAQGRTRCVLLNTQHVCAARFSPKYRSFRGSVDPADFLPFSRMPSDAAYDDEREWVV